MDEKKPLQVQQTEEEQLKACEENFVIYRKLALSHVDHQLLVRDFLINARDAYFGESPARTEQERLEKAAFEAPANRVRLTKCALDELRRLLINCCGPIWSHQVLTQRLSQFTSVMAERNKLLEASTRFKTYDAHRFKLE